MSKATKFDWTMLCILIAWFVLSVFNTRVTIKIRSSLEEDVRALEARVEALESPKVELSPSLSPSPLLR